MKKKIVSLALAVCLLAIAAVGTLAYFTDKDSAKNVITMGNVDITLDEAKVQQGNNGEYTVPDATDRVQENTYTNVYPGQALPKDPTVTNKGSMGAYVRVKVAFPVKGDNAQKSFSDVGSLFAIGATDYMFGKLETYNLPALFEGFDASKWTVEQTAYNMPFFGTPDNILELTFTYNEVLAPGANAVLFTGVNIDKAINTSIDVTMDITAEAIQAQGFNTPAEAFANFNA